MHQWWNRQTRTLEGRMGRPVQVQVLSGAPDTYYPNQSLIITLGDRFGLIIYFDDLKNLTFQTTNFLHLYQYDSGRRNSKKNGYRFNAVSIVSFFSLFNLLIARQKNS